MLTSSRFIGQWSDVVFEEDDLFKARARMFASRSEAGRYAAHIRWANNRGQQPLTVEQWRAQGGVTAPQGGGADTSESGLAKQLAPLIAEAKEAMRVVNDIERQRLFRAIIDDQLDAVEKDRIANIFKNGTDEQINSIIVGYNERFPSDSVQHGSKDAPKIDGERWLNATPEQRTAMYLEASQQALTNGRQSNYVHITAHSNQINDQMVPAQHLIDAMEKVTAVGRVAEAHIAKGMVNVVKANQNAFDEGLARIKEAADRRSQAQEAYTKGTRRLSADKDALDRELLDRAWREGLPRKGFSRKDHPLNPIYAERMKVIKAETKKLETELRSAQEDVKKAMTLSKSTGMIDGHASLVDEVLAVKGSAKGLVSFVPMGGGQPVPQRVQTALNDVLGRLPEGVGRIIGKNLGPITFESSQGGGAFGTAPSVGATMRVSDGFKTNATIISVTEDFPGRMSVRSVLSHELTHALEYASPGVHNVVAAFRESRLYSYEPTISTRSTIPEGVVGHIVHSNVRPFAERVGIIQSRLGHDNTLAPSSSQDVSGSFVFPDKFGDRYAGRIYAAVGESLFSMNDRLTSRPDGRRYSNEQLTTGVQALMYGNESSQRFGNTDSEHISFSLGMLLTAGDIG